MSETGSSVALDYTEMFSKYPRDVKTIETAIVLEQVLLQPHFGNEYFFHAYRMFVLEIIREGGMFGAHVCSTGQQAVMRTSRCKWTIKDQINKT